MSDSTFSHKRSIELPDGNILEVEMTDKFVDILKFHFDVATADDVTNDMVRLYVYGSLNTALKANT